MLHTIQLKNYTIVDQLNLELQRGFSVLTGETGAGKSIIIGAIQLALGARSDSKVVRAGCEQCDIHLCFDVSDSEAATAWLKEHDLNSNGGECILRRTINQDGRSKLTINGLPCPQNLMREFASTILNIHGQHQHQLLFEQKHQQALVDRFAHHENLLEKIQAYYHNWQALQQKITALQAASNHDQELAFINFQLEELKQLNLQTNEWEELSAQHKKLAHAQEIAAYLAQCRSALEYEQGAITTTQTAIESLRRVTAYSDSYQNTATLLEQALVNLEEALNELNDQDVTLDENELAALEQRLSLIHNLARKHHCEPAALLNIQAKLSQQQFELSHIQEHIHQLQSEQQKILHDYQKLAVQLTQQRQQAIAHITPLINQHLHNLGMPDAEFAIALTPHEQVISAQGQERLAFMIRTNAGQSMQPLNKIISGGELSRLSLAIEVILFHQQTTPTLIFDEVDVGIGGQTANTVAALLKQLGQKAQVLCITHLAQVASRADHQFKVSKHSKDQQTFTTIELLTKNARIQEIARMLGGDETSAQAKAHAKELLVK